MRRKPPKTYDRFVERFPSLGAAWDMLHAGGREAGPLQQRERLLVKLAVAIGAHREGAVHSAVRKARVHGIPVREIEQVVALAASTVGLPSAVAAWTWVLDKKPRRPVSKR